MSYRPIVVSSRAMGRRDRVTVKVYDTLTEMRAASKAYNGGDNSDALAVTQASRYRLDDGTTALCSVTVRLVRQHMGARIVSHEVHHAATAIYGDRLGERLNRRRQLNHYNEPMAHLFSDLYSGLVVRLYALGYYDD